MKKIFYFVILFLSHDLLAESKFESAFKNVWNESKQQIYPEALVEKYFTDENKSVLLRDIKKVDSWYSFERILNPFLLSLNVSHTYFYSVENEDYYFMRSLFTSKDLMNPKIYHIGMQTKKDGDYFYVRTTLEGYPASRIGLRRGDKLLSVNQKPFHPYLSFNEPSSKAYKIKFERNNKIFKKSIKPIFESPHWSFVNASINSAKVFSINKKKIGYYHLWTGTHPSALEEFKKALSNKLTPKNTDGLIIDLRDGFGGAWWAYLDPFFVNRTSYFEATIRNKSGEDKVLSPPQQINKDVYTKPIVIISNEGVRSGKESLVYQFKKTK